MVNVTSGDRVYRDWQRGLRDRAVAGRRAGAGHHLQRLVGSRRRPVVSVHDAASHTLAWIGAALGMPQVPLGVDRFGESGRIDELRALTATDTGTVVNAALLALDMLDGT